MEPSDILSPSRPLGKSTVSATLVARLERKGQRISELLARFSHPQSLDLYVIAQHQVLGVWVQIDLLVYPTLRWGQAPGWAPDTGSGDA
jgi:hypothetical protein